MRLRRHVLGFDDAAVEHGQRVDQSRRAGGQGVPARQRETFVLRQAAQPGKGVADLDMASASVLRAKTPFSAKTSFSVFSR